MEFNDADVFMIDIVPVSDDMGARGTVLVRDRPVTDKRARNGFERFLRSLRAKIFQY
jgi:hypothetical protein